MHVAVQVRCLSLIPAVTVALLAGSSLSCDLDSLQHSSERVSGDRTEFSNGNSDSENEEEPAIETKNNKAVMKVDDWISFHGEDDVLELIMSLRIKLLSSFVRKISSEGRAWSQSDDAIIQCVVNVLTEEESLTGQSSPDRNAREGRKSIANGRQDKSVNWNPERGQSRGQGAKRYHSLSLCSYIINIR